MKAAAKKLLKEAGSVDGFLPPKSHDSTVWNACIEHGKAEVPEIKDDRPAIRRALKESRMRHTTRARSYLP